AAESLITARADEIAALVIEPLMQGAAGMIAHPPGYLKRIADCCKDHGVLLIADEVATGFGRTGTLFACEQEGVRPDLICLAEGLARTVELPHVGDVRQRGLMIGIELVKDRPTKEEYPYAERMGHRVCLAARKREVMLRPLGNVVVLMPPLSISAQEVDFLSE